MFDKINLKPTQILVLGVLSYIIFGMILISLPICQKSPISFIDNLFSIVSAVSTTGLLTVSVADNYTWYGQLVLVIMFQLGGWGFMTTTSFFFLAVNNNMSRNRIKILNTSYCLPEDFDIKKFIRNTVLFTLIIEIIGAVLLWIFFSKANMPDALWSAVFHSVSAFATAGFGMYNNSLMDFSLNVPVNLTIGILCYFGAIGFIVLQDLYYNFKKKKKITFTSKVILYMTLIIFVLGTVFFYFTEPSIQTMCIGDRLLVSVFQIMSASTTAGFNSIDISILSRAALFLVIIVMIIGASPSGTGGGIKTTSVSALSGVISSIIKKREVVVFMNHEIPMNRVFNAVAATTIYVTVLSIGMFLLSITDIFEFEKLFFEAASALGTVGLSTGITSSLSYAGKIIIIILMYLGRVGPISIGISLFGIRKEKNRLKIFYKKDDLAV